MLKSDKSRVIYTIGHSTHPIEVFLEMLQSFEIETVVDVRKMPGSRKFPQFNQDVLQEVLEKNGIRYVYASDLGGRRKINKDSHNTIWRNASFRAYADYMETKEFKQAIRNFEEQAITTTTVIMCSEAVWWRCHRSMISDALKATAWNVQHIMGVHKSNEHPYTGPAQVVNGEVVYGDGK